MQKTITVTPAYGRDYTTETQVREDWEAGKDFVVADGSSRWDGAYINLEDARRAGIETVKIRFSKLTEVCLVQVSQAA